MPLGVLDLNENKVDEMIKIMEFLHKYVPSRSKEVVYTFSDSEEAECTETNFHHIVCGGDQLKVARERAAKLVRHHSESSIDRLSGLVPCVEDWHANQVFVKVSH